MPRPATTTLRVRPLTSTAGPVGRRPRRPVLALVAVVAGSSMALGGCLVMSPVQTNVPYQPADGVNLTLGSLEARGLVLVSAAKGSPGVLVGSLINTGAKDLTVTFLTQDQVQSGSTSGAPTAQVKAFTQQDITGVQLDAVTQPPGALETVVMQTTAGQVNAGVPVLPPDGYYATISPTAVPTSATAGPSGAATTATTGATGASTDAGATGSTTAPATSATTAATGG